MSSIKVIGDCTVIKRHFILLLFSILKFFFFLFITGFIYYIYVLLWNKLESEISYFMYILLGFVFILLNYTFIKFILDLIEYHNNLIIIQDDHIVIIKSSLFFKDDFEIIDSYRVMKIDSFCHWFIANVLGYWNLVIEQQKDDVRTFHFIPEPFKILKLLRDQKDYVLNERKKKYIVTWEDNNIELH